MPKKISLSDIGKIYGDESIDLSVYTGKGSYMLFTNASIRYVVSVAQLHIDAGNCFTNGGAGIRLSGVDEIIDSVDYYEDTKFCNIKFNNGMPTMSIQPTEVEKYRGYPDDWIPPKERKRVSVPQQE
ncbi:MAG: hypothetical protein LIP10_12970 [Clostridiales bacterium]|nr:hypothetical protein [Clostridiales bacterium]